MIILGIDPGTNVSGWAMLDTKMNAVVDSGVADNDQLLYGLNHMPADMMAIEVFEARGMPIGNDSIETILFTGMLIHAWPHEVQKVRRSQIKLHLCGTARAKDGNIRQSLIDRFGPPGTKKKPGGTYGVASHGWAALAAATVAMDTNV